jgi:protein-S-isoprenylcysteine O-methyltransferase Ste14
MTTTEPRRELSRRLGAGAALALGYAIACYLLFLAAFGYGIAFLADVPVPRTIDHGGPLVSSGIAVVVDAVLLAVFAVQHSVMARPAFKQRWTRLVPRHVERSTYVLLSSAALALVFWQWRPIPKVVWDMSAPGTQAVIWVAYGLGWLWVLVMSGAIDHLGMFGLRQVTRHVRGRSEWRPSFGVPLPYRVARHPMMIGFFVAFLATPTMSVGHLLFATLGCGYIVVGVRLEERDLVAELPEYAAYAAVTPRFVPRLRSSRRRRSRPRFSRVC